MKAHVNNNYCWRWCTCIGLRASTSLSNYVFNCHPAYLVFMSPSVRKCFTWMPWKCLCWTWTFTEAVYDIQVDNSRVLIKADHVYLENKECMTSSIKTCWTWTFTETVYDIQVDNSRVLIKADHVSFGGNRMSDKLK